jgi:hypothetical protein
MLVMQFLWLVVSLVVGGLLGFAYFGGQLYSVCTGLFLGAVAYASAGNYRMRKFTPDLYVEAEAVTRIRLLAGLSCYPFGTAAALYWFEGRFNGFVPYKPGLIVLAAVLPPLIFWFVRLCDRSLNPHSQQLRR